MPMRLRGSALPAAAPPFSGLGLGQPANCTAVSVGGCQACLDFGRAAAGAGGDGGGGCVWCPQEGGCISALACPTAADTCTYVMYIRTRRAFPTMNSDITRLDYPIQSNPQAPSTTCGSSPSG